MTDDKFWQIIDDHKIYIDSNSIEGHHEYLLRLAFKLKMLPRQESKNFITVLYEKFHVLYSIEHLKNYALMYISPEFFKNKDGYYVFVLDDRINSKQKLYNCGLMSNYRDFRYNLIRHGKEVYSEFKKNPSGISELIPIACAKMEDSIFKIEEYIDKYRYYNFDYYNYGTFLDGLRWLVDKQRMMEKIKFGNYIEDTASILPFLTDFTKKQSLFDALPNFDQTEKIVILNCIERLDGNTRFL